MYYLSGPMSGIEKFNFPTFNEAAGVLRARGYTVVNPAETDGGSTDKTREYYMRADIEALLKCDGIIMLAGWERARGAVLELEVARQIGLKLFLYDPEAADVRPFESKEETILQEAQRLVFGDRGKDYGHPADDYGRVAKMAECIFNFPVTAKQAALFMCCVKLSREVNRPKRDNLTDLAGYAQVAHMIQERVDGKA